MDGSQFALGSDASAFLYLSSGFPNEGGQSKSRYRRESIRPLPAARDMLQFRHGALQGCQSQGALPLDQGLERLTNQRRFLRHPGELLGDAYEIVIKRNCCPHSTVLIALIIASNDVICRAYQFVMKWARPSKAWTGHPRECGKCGSM